MGIGGESDYMILLSHHNAMLYQLSLNHYKHDVNKDLIQTINRTAFNISVLFWLASGLAFLVMTLTIDRDENSVQDKILESIHNRRYRDTQNERTLSLTRGEVKPPRALESPTAIK